MFIASQKTTNSYAKKLDSRDDPHVKKGEAKHHQARLLNEARRKCRKARSLCRWIAPLGDSAINTHWKLSQEV